MRSGAASSRPCWQYATTAYQNSIRFQYSGDVAGVINYISYNGINVCIRA
jgi:hypothetical protein